MLSNNNDQSDALGNQSVIAPRAVHNHNHSSGSFYQTNGTQNIFIFNLTNSALSVLTARFDPRRMVEEGVPSRGGSDRELTTRAPDLGEIHDKRLEPFRTVIESFSNIHQHSLAFSGHFPSNGTISGVCAKAEGLVPLTRCVEIAMCLIEQANPAFFFHPSFTFVSRRAFHCTIRLKKAFKCLDELAPQQHPPRARRKQTTFSWPTLSQRLQECFTQCQTVMMEFLLIFGSSNSLCIKAQPVTNRNTLDLRHLQSDTVWVRDPTGSNWYGIPLRFCKTWKDLSVVIYQYCRNGPWSDRIRRGNWAIIQEANKKIIDQTSFTRVLKPGMRFDIGVIFEPFQETSECPQCGHDISRCTPENGWITCSDMECANKSRIVKPIGTCMGGTLVPSSRPEEPPANTNRASRKDQSMLPELKEGGRTGETTPFRRSELYFLNNFFYL